MRMDDKWWIGKDLEESGLGQIEVLPRHLPEGTEENNDKPVWTAYGWTEIRTEHLLNASLERYHCPNLLSHVVVEPLWSLSVLMVF
jgi:hypothetical protein